MTMKSDCQYMGYEFSAGYIDSQCIDGRLFDCDNCDNEGNLYEPMDYIPCPICYPSAAKKWYAQQMYGLNPKTARRFAKRVVKDIRSHCDVKTGQRHTFL